MRVDVFEHFVIRPPQMRFDQHADIGGGNGRHIALQLLEFFNPLCIKNIHARGEHLPQLHKRRPQLFKRQPKAPGRAHIALIRCRFIIGTAHAFVRKLDALDKFAQSVLRQNRHDFAHTREIAHGK